MSGRYVYAGVKLRKRNHLPHLDTPHGLYFITFCLKDALTPTFRAAQASRREEYFRQVLRRFGEIRWQDRVAYEREAWRETETELDRGRGGCALADPRAAQIVSDALRYFHGIRYRLFNDAVMSNHVHLSLETKPGHAWRDVIGSVKQYTAVRINRLLGRCGPLWQDDGWDRLIRDDRHFERVFNYIKNNPRRIGRSGLPWYEEFPGNT